MAFATISPKWAERLPDFRTPFSMATEDAGTPQAAAAAATSTSRAAAPALRYCKKLLAMAVEPPVPCVPKRKFL